MDKNTRTAAEIEIDEANRRIFPRVSSRCLVDYRVLGDESPLNELGEARGLVQNISGGGVCVVMPEDPGAGQLMALDIRLPGLPSSVISLGKVRWSVPTGDGAFEVGIEFWWIGWESAQAQESIRTFIKHSIRGDDGAA